MLSQQPPFHFCQDSLPHLGLLSCSLESLLNSPSSSNLPLSEWTVLYSFASLLCLWKHTGQCRKLGTKNIHALPLFSAVCLDQMDGPGDWTESASTEGTELARTYWGICFVGCEKIPTKIHNCITVGNHLLAEVQTNTIQHSHHLSHLSEHHFLGLFWNKGGNSLGILRICITQNSCQKSIPHWEVAGYWATQLQASTCSAYFSATKRQQSVRGIKPTGQRCSGAASEIPLHEASGLC